MYDLRYMGLSGRPPAPNLTSIPQYSRKKKGKQKNKNKMKLADFMMARLPSPFHLLIQMEAGDGVMPCSQFMSRKGEGF